MIAVFPVPAPTLRYRLPVVLYFPAIAASLLLALSTFAVLPDTAGLDVDVLPLGADPSTETMITVCPLLFVTRISPGLNFVDAVTETFFANRPDFSNADGSVAVLKLPKSMPVAS